MKGQKGHPRGKGERGNDLIDSLDRLWDLALYGVGSAVAGVAVGALLRAAGFSWTWALIATGPVVVAAELLGGTKAAVLAGLAGACAVGIGVVRSLEARQEGGVSRERELRRKGPGSLLVRETRLRRRRGERIRRDPRRGSRLALGQTSDRSVIEIPFGVEKGVHGLLVGATDSGKTTDARSLIQAHVRAGHAVIAADAKGDDALEQTMRREAELAGRPFHLWTPRGPSTYNVAGRGGPSEVADKLLSAHEWSEPHYLSVALRFCQREVEVLRAAGVEPSLASIARFMEPDRLDGLAATAGEEILERVEVLTADLPRRMLDDLAGARSRIALLAESEFGSWLLPSENGTPEVELGEVVRAGGVAYFRLDADRYPQLAQILAASLIVDLIGVSADNQGGRLRGLLFIDEFAAIGADQIARLFATARSAGLSTLLATQGLADMRAARDDGGADTLTSQVLQNVSYVIAHRISDPEAAELLAGMAGTYESWKLTREVEGHFLPVKTGSGSRIPTQEFRVHPNEFKALGRGEAVVIEPSAGAVVGRIWMPTQ